MRISYSIFDTFNRCPLQYKFSYIDHIQKPHRVELDFGSLMHSIVENTLKKDPIIPEIKETLKLFEIDSQNIVFKDEREKKQYLSVGQNIIKTFYNSLKPGLRDTIATEKRFYFKLDDKHALSGVIDRVDKLPYGAYEIIDYKTNFKPKTQQDVDKDKQLGMYHLAVKELWPEAKDIRLSMYFLKPDLKLSTTRRDDEIETLKEELIQTAEKIEKETEFQPRKNPLCNWCDYKHLCPVFRTPGVGLKRSEEKIDDLVEEYILAQQKLKELEPKIHKHFDCEKIEKFAHRKGMIERGKNKKLIVRKK